MFLTLLLHWRADLYIQWPGSSGARRSEDRPGSMFRTRFHWLARGKEPAHTSPGKIIEGDGI